MNPQAQLAAFAERADEHAFRRIAESYSSLVYGIALRKTSSPETAEEITQNVFLIVAHKARALSKRQGFVAWLHRTTAYEAANFLRAESHRKRTMKRYALDLETETAEQQHVHQNLREMVDDAIASLSTRDRRALLYRFFEGRDFKDIGSLMGKSEAAAQKQTRRALDKLSSLLRKRGVVTSVTVLASLLTSELAKAAPAGLATGVAKHAMTELARTSTLPSALTLAMTTKKSFTIAGIILLAGLIPLTKQQAAIEKLSEQREQLLTAEYGKQRAASLVPTHRPTNQRNATEDRSKPIEAITLVRAFLKDMGRLGAMRLTGTGLKEVGKELGGFSDHELWNLYEEIDTASAGSDVKQEVKEWLLLNHLASRNPAETLETALDDAMREEVFVQVMRQWASKDSRIAADWLAKNRQNGRLSARRLDGAPPESALLRGLVEGIADTSLDDALTFVHDHARSEDVATLISGLSRAFLESGDHDSYLALAASLAEPSERLSAFANHATSILLKAASPEETLNDMNTFLHHPSFPAAERESVLAETADHLALAIHRGAISRQGMLPWMMVRSTRTDNLALFTQTGEPLDSTRGRLINILRNAFGQPITDNPVGLDGTNTTGKR